MEHQGPRRQESDDQALPGGPRRPPREDAGGRLHRRPGVQHRPEERHGRRDVPRPEEDPGDADQEERGQGQDEPARRALPEGPAVEAPPAEPPLQDDVEPVKGSPDHEHPRGAVPQPAEEHGRHEVEGGPAGPPAISPEGKVEVVPEPGREADVPPVPEVGESPGGIRVPEVVGEVEPEAEARTDRAQGVTGKVVEDLHAEGQRPRPGGEETRRRFPVEDRLDGRSRHGVREHHLREEADHEQAQPPSDLPRASRFRFPAPGEEVGGPDDGTGHELGEEGHEQRVVEERRGRLEGPPVDVDGVGHRLERVEGDAHGQDDAPGIPPP